MPIRLIASISRCVLLTVFAVGLLQASAWAQNNNNNNNNNNTNNNNDNGNANVAGIEVDASGVLRVRQIDPRVVAAQRAAALQSRPAGSVRSSELRKVSITRLEKEVAKAIAAGKPYPLKC